MAITFKQKDMWELRTPVKLLKPTGTEKYNGVNRCTYPADGDLIYCEWKTYGGTETTVNGVYSVLDTAIITTWYRPDIAANCRILREDGAIYEIINEPENIKLQSTYIQFKIRRVKGGA